MTTELKPGDIVRLINQGDLPPIDLSSIQFDLDYMDTSEEILYEVKSVQKDFVNLSKINSQTMYSYSSVHKAHCVLVTPLEDRPEYFIHIDSLSTIRILYLDKKELNTTTSATIHSDCPIPLLQEAIQKLQAIQVSEQSSEA